MVTTKEPERMKLKQDRLKSLSKRKFRAGDKPICAITAYDYPTARVLDEVGVDIILVGDSLGMVVLGFPDTTHVTLEHMCHHTEAVARGAKDTLILGDLPINTYDTPEQALATAKVLVNAGADAVKLEGGIIQEEKIRKIIEAGIPVIGHLGMLPQSVLEEGGYKKKGKTQEQANRLIDSARCLEQVGCTAIILESVIPKVAQDITNAISIPTIGIGCGRTSCDGEVAVITDVIGSYPWFVPPFATPRASVADDIKRAVTEYKEAIGKEV